MLTHCNFRPEEKLLIACTRTEMPSKKIEQIKILLQQKINWNYFLQIAAHHQVASLLYKNIKSHFSDLVPQFVLAELQEYFQINSRRSLSITLELFKILDSLKKEDIPAIFYKGPVLAAALYKDFTLHKFVDLDIFIHQRNALKAKKILENYGYSSLFKLTQEQQEDLLQIDRKQTFTRNKIHIDLHWRTDLSFFSFSRPDTDETLWENLETVSLANKFVKTFSPENLLLILCFHGAKHAWKKLNWICEVAETLRTYDNINWKWVIKRAYELNGQRMLFLGLRLATDLFEVNLPQNIIQEIENDLLKVGVLTKKVKERLFKKQHRLSKFLANNFLYLQTFERWTDKIKFCLRCTIPTPQDWVLLPLPKSLCALYYFIRPVRLIAKYIFKLIRGLPKTDLATYAPSSPAVIKKMLELAEVGPQDIVYDLGCGDGRIVIAAAKMHGARGVGIDIDPQRISEAKENAHQAGVGSRVQFLLEDVKQANVGSATVVTLYLPTPIYPKLKSLLQNRLRPGARVVTCTFFINDLPLIQKKIFKEGPVKTKTLYLYRVPEKAPSMSS